MRFLLDTNVFIALEPGSTDDVETGAERAAELLRVLNEAGHQICVHPASLADIRRDNDADRRELRELLFQKYTQLKDPPPLNDEIESVLGASETSSNDWVDHCLLTSVHRDAVDCLVTNDFRCIKKGKRLELEERVFTIADCVTYVQSLLNKIPTAPPKVETVKAYNIDERDSIFDSFREDYEKFDNWLLKCKREQRTSWIIEGSDGDYAGIVIIKEEAGALFAGEKTLKICSFKVSPHYRGLRYGELLLKTVFDYIRLNTFSRAYLIC